MKIWVHYIDPIALCTLSSLDFLAYQSARSYLSWRVLAAQKNDNTTRERNVFVFKLIFLNVSLSKYGRSLVFHLNLNQQKFHSNTWKKILQK